MLFVHAGAQNTIGIPSIVNYSKQTYNAGSQNWGIAQDKKGFLYFANSQGLLSFDGSSWRKYSLPNKTIVRSVAIDGDDRIYVGGQSEFGYFKADEKGGLHYTSLLPLLNEAAKDFTDIWNICFYDGKVFFRAYRKVFVYDRKNITSYDGDRWSFLSMSSKLLAYETNKGLVKFQNNNWLPAIKYGSLPVNAVLRSAISFGDDSILLATLNQGLFVLHHDSISKFVTADVEEVAKQNIYNIILLDNDRMAVSTSLSGCFIMHKSGRFIQNLSKNDGIQNNNILSSFLDKDKNLWLGLDNGIDLVLYNNAIRQLFPEPEDRSAGYTSIIHNNQLYLGLSSGAYTVPLHETTDISYSAGKFEQIQGSKGQVWSFSIVNDQLIIGHNSGAYLVANNTLSPLDASTGFWDFQAIHQPKALLQVFAGTYNGINFYQYADHKFSDPKIHARFESARFIVQHGDAIWVAHPYKGLYIIKYDSAGKPQVFLYDDKNKVLSTNHNKISAVGEKLVLTNDNGIFEYDDRKADFVRSDFLESHLKSKTVSYLKQDKYGNLWFCKDRRVGVLEDPHGRSKIIFIPELNNRIQSDGFEHINIIDSNNVIIAGEKGFFHLNYAAYKKTRYPLRALISNVRSITPKDSLLFGGYSALSSIPSIAYSYNSLHFEVSTTLYGQENTIEYSYYLEGFDKSWSEWAKKTEKDYTNIPPGNYTLKVKCRNNFDNESPVTGFSFSILPPYYRTWWAYAFYTLLFVATLYYFYKRQQKKYKKQQQQKLLEQQRKYAEEQKRLQMEHELAVSENEKRIAQLQREKLQAEIEHKNTELASSAMNLVHKAEILSKLKDDLLHYKETAQPGNGIKEFQKIIKLIDAELDHAEDWEKFARHFDNVHFNYLKKLKEYCPELTTSELKLAAYLRLNLSTKEIAQLLNISVRGVETSRYRLRKKLGLTNEEANLYGFLLEVTK